MVFWASRIKSVALARGVAHALATAQNFRESMPVSDSDFEAVPEHFRSRVVRARPPAATMKRAAAALPVLASWALVKTRQSTNTLRPRCLDASACPNAQKAHLLAASQPRFAKSRTRIAPRALLPSACFWEADTTTVLFRSTSPTKS